MDSAADPATESAIAPAAAGHLIAFLRALPTCQSVEDVARAVLDQALLLTGSRAAVAFAPAVPPLALTAGAPDEDLLAHTRATWAAAAQPGEPIPPVPAALDGGAPDVLLVPLSSGDRLYGLLGLRLAAPLDAPLTEALGVLTAAAGQRLNMQVGLSQMHRRLTELSMLYEVATALGATLDLPELLTLFVERAREALRSEASTLMLLDESTQELVFEIPTGESGHTLQQLRIPLSEGICGWVARTARPAVVNDLRADPRFNSSIDRQSGFRTRNVLAVPLQARGRVIGVIEVLNKRGAEAYTNRDLDLLTTLAGQAAVALDNAQLYTSLQAEHTRLVEAEDQVRKELARDLHDGPAQQMAAIVMQVEVLRKLLARDPSRLPAELDALEALARKANRQVRTLQFQLRPVMLETRGLRAALEYYVNQLRETETMHFTTDFVGCTGRLPAQLERASFDIVQEALGNIRKHSGARFVTVRMWREVDRWVIVLQDDGKGFDVAATLRSYETRGSLGLLNMRERAQAMGGKLELLSAPGRGTRVVLEIPTTAYVPNEDSMTMALVIPPEGLGGA